MCELLSAVRDGREGKTSELLSSEYFYNLPSWNQGQGIVLLREALARGHRDIAKLLLSKGARVNNKFGNPTNDPLHFAVCLKDNSDMISLLIEEGAKINSTNGDGCTPLHLAVFTDNETAAKMLLESQAAPDSEDLFRNTPLHVAAERGFPNMAELLLEYKANPDLPLANGFTPLHLACLHAKKDTAFVLLDRGADPNACSDEGTPLDLAYPDREPMDSLDQRTLIVQRLLQVGSKVNSFNNNGKSILHRAVENNCPEIVAATITHSNVNAVTIDVSHRSLLSPIQIAALKGFGDITDMLITHGADINMPCNVSFGGNYTPLHLACSYGHINIARTLLEHGADTEVKSLEGRTPLLAAIFHFKGDVDTLLQMVQLLVDSGANVRTLDQDSASILHAAAENQCLPLSRLILQLLSDAQADLLSYVNLPTITGLAPLHMTAANGSIEMAEFLLSQGANINMVSKAPTSDGLTALHVASKNARMNIVKLFLDCGANANAFSPINQTPAHVLLSTPDNFTHSKLQNAISVLAVLLENLVDIDCVDKNGNTILNLGVKLRCLPVVETILRYKPDPQNPINRSALRSAVISGTKFTDDVFSDFSLKLRTDAIKEVKSIIQTLQDYGIKFNESDIKDSIVLHHAIRKGLLSVVQYLLDHGADFKAQSDFGTPLHSAVRMLQVEIARILIKMGAVVNAKDTLGNTPIYYVSERLSNLNSARDFGDSQICLNIARELLKGGADLTDDSKFLMIAVQNKNEELVKMALKCNADVNVVASNGFTTLHVAVRGDGNIVKLLLDHGVPIDARDVILQTPLHRAIHLMNTNVANILLERGADVNLVDSRGYTPLHLAALRGNKLVIERLLELGADTEALNNESVTPLLLAAAHFNGRAVMALLRGGADPNAKRPDEKTALHLAAERTDELTVETLLYYGADITATASGTTVLGAGLQACKPRVVQVLLDYGGFTPDMCCNLTQASNWFSKRRAEGSTELTMITQFHFLTMEALRLWPENAACSCRSSFKRNISELFDAELKLLKSKSITKNLNFFDIISKPKHQLVSLARNDSVVQSLAQTDFCKEFPISGKLLRYRWKTAVTRQKLLSTGIPSFNTLIMETVVKLINQHDDAFTDTLNRFGYRWILRVLKFRTEELSMSNAEFVQYLQRIQSLLPAAVVEKILGYLFDSELGYLRLAAPTSPNSPPSLDGLSLGQSLESAMSLGLKTNNFGPRFGSESNGFGQRNNFAKDGKD